MQRAGIKVASVVVCVKVAGVVVAVWSKSLILKSTDRQAGDDR